MTTGAKILIAMLLLAFTVGFCTRSAFAQPAAYQIQLTVYDETGRRVGTVTHNAVNTKEDCEALKDSAELKDEADGLLVHLSEHLGKHVVGSLACALAQGRPS